MMRYKFLSLILCLFVFQATYAQNVFSVVGNKTYLNNKHFLAIGLRCSNALLSDETTNALIDHLNEYKEYGVNTVSVYFMGSRYSNINGYNLDGTLKEDYKIRMGKIIEACDKRNMVVLVGILYWGAQMGSLANAYYENWQQIQVNEAMRNTIIWLKENNYRNVFIDPDNEGMAERGAGFNIDEMICEGQKVDASYYIAYNGQGYPPPCADLSIHFGKKTQHMPYIETEGTPPQYWGAYSKEEGLDHYINVGMYTEGKKEKQLKETKELLDQGHGYLFASTWLQNVPPIYDIGGDGSPCDPGIKWWLEFIKENYKDKQ